MTEMTQSSKDYSAEKITVLKGLEAVRKRPAMYIGDISVDIVGGTSFTDFTNRAVADFFDEADEQYDATITAVAQDNATYENILSNTIANGASSDDNSVVGTITNVILSITPDNTSVDEDDFSVLNSDNLVGDRLDNDNSTPLDDTDDTVTNNLTKLNLSTELTNSEYKFVFENSVNMTNDNGTNQTLKSNGSVISTAVSTDGSTITGTDALGNKVFDIVLSNGTDDSGTDDGYINNNWYRCTKR